LGVAVHPEGKSALFNTAARANAVSAASGSVVVVVDATVRVVVPVVCGDREDARPLLEHPAATKQIMNNVIEALRNTGARRKAHRMTQTSPGVIP